MVYSYFISCLLLIPLLFPTSALISILVIALKFFDNNYDIDIISKVRSDFKGYVLSFTKQFLSISWKILLFLLLLCVLTSIILIALQLVFHFQPTFRFHLK